MFYQQRSTRQILTEGTRLYLRHFGCLTRPLLYPLLAQLGGVVLWLVLAYESVNVLTVIYPNLNIWLLWAVFVVSNLPGLYIFLHGFWHYLVWVAGLNLIVRELSDTGACHNVLAYSLRITTRPADYSVIWTFLFGILFVPFGLSVLPIALGASHPEWYWLAIIGSVALLFIGLLLACTLLIFFSLVFQVFAFTPGSAGLSLFRSMDLVGHDVVKTLFIIVAAVGMTQFVLPTVITAGLDAMKLIQPLALLLGLVLEHVLERSLPDLLAVQQQYPFMAGVVKLLTVHPQPLLLEIARTIVFTFVSALLLPLGTCWFALLYADLKTRAELSESQAEPLLETPQAVL